MPENFKKELKELALGSKIRSLRQKKGLTIQELSEKAGLSKALISQIENEQVSPPISTLIKIANALKVEIAYFFMKDEADKKIAVVRKDERITSSRRGIKGNVNIGYTYEMLAHKKNHKHMEPFIVTFEPRDREDVIMFSHKGEEFHFVLEGKIEFLTDIEEPIILSAGDALYFESDISHGFRALESKPAKTVAVLFQAD